MSNGGLGHRIGRIFRPLRIAVAVLAWQASWDRKKCWWCGEEMRWSTRSPAETRVGHPVHAECLEPAEREEAPWT